MLVAIKEGRYLARDGVYTIQPRETKDERPEWTNKSPSKNGESVKSRCGEKPDVGSNIQSNSSAPHTPPDSPPKMTDTPPKIGQTSKELSSPKNFVRNTLSPINSNHLFTPPNLTPPVASRPYFKKIVKNGKKLNFKVEQ